MSALRSPTGRRRFAIVHNPHAGLDGLKLTDAVARELERAGADVQLQDVVSDHWIDDFTAALDHVDAVVASGGDGTIRYLAQAMASRQRVPLGIIPNGTGNVLAEELGISRRAKMIADTLRLGPTATITGAWLNANQAIFLMCGIGFDGEVIARLNQTTKQRFGKAAYAWPVLSVLSRRPRLFDVNVDGAIEKASWIVISNARCYGGRFKLIPETSVTTPDFHIVLSRATRRSQRLLELLALPIGQLSRCPTIETRRCTRVTVDDARGIPIQVDGDACGETPAVVDCTDAPDMTIIMPQPQLA